MRKIFRSVFFIVGLIGILLVTSAFMKPKAEVYDAIEVSSKLDDLAEEPDNTIDVLFAGDSEAYSSFIPCQMWQNYGFTSYVCGIRAQRLCDTYELIKSAFKTQSPKVVVLEADNFYRYAGTEKDPDDKSMSYASKVFPVLKYHSRWKNAMKSAFTSKETNIKEKLHKGFCVRNSVKPYTGGEYMIETSKVKEVPELSAEYINKIKALCDENKAQLIIVSVPSPDNWNYSKHNGTAAFAEQADITYIDMNLMVDKLEIDWNKDSKDGGNHLNIHGARKVTGYIGQYLNDNYDLPDHSEDPDYSAWNKNII